jgi:glycyl-tRNA synthetase
MHTGKSDFRAWRSFKESKTVKIDKWFPVQSSIGPSFKGLASAVSKAIGDLVEIPESLPFTVTLDDGTEISIDEGMAERRTEDRIVTGEWFTPHVVEPAFGIDRIIWHILDHAYEENVKEGEHYAVLRLPQKTAPFDAVVLPLFDKDGMDDMAETIAATLSRVPGVKVQYDNSKSIGRRYARADEAGIPWAITVDHQSLEDSSVTLRRRDDGKQVRCSVADLQSILCSHGQDMLF